MELEWETRPLSIVHHPRGWHNQASNSAGASSSNAPGSTFSQASVLSQRRRSAAVRATPAPPPPNQPIPGLPKAARASTSLDSTAGPLDAEQDIYLPQPQQSGSGFSSTPFSRPGGSANLAAVAAFSEARHASSANGSPHPGPNGSSSPEALSDPPPRSILHASSSRAFTQHQEIVPDRLLLSPPEPRLPTKSRPSSRRALTRALELAREAVKLDSTNDDPYGAVMAYGRSVALLSEVMERVRRGEDSTEPRRRNGRRRSVVAQEEEVRRLKTIHDTYADRMNILSLIYSIPPIPHSPSLVFASSPSVSTHSTQPSSPTSNSPTSDSCDLIPHAPIDHTQDDSRQISANGIDQDLDATEAIGSAMFDLDATAASPGSFSGSLPGGSSSYHPYAAVSPIVVASPPVLPPTTFTRNIAPSPAPTSSRRSRASSALPPPPPPPLNSPPPAPGTEETPSDPKHLSVVGRPRGNSIGHKRTGSGSKLAALEEESEKQDEPPLQPQQEHPLPPEQELLDPDHRSALPDTPRIMKRDNPLPPLPSPSSSRPASSISTPRPVVALEKSTQDVQPEHQAAPKARSGSTLSVRSELYTSQSQQHLINPSTASGTISQRRSKASAPPSTRARSSSPTDSTQSTGSTSTTGLPTLTASSLPTSTASGLNIGRSRALSQPGRRPSLINGRVSPMNHRPSMPPPATANGVIVSRKASFPSKFTSNSSSQLFVQTDLTPANSLVPPPPMFPGNLPTTPTSPLPSAPPPDALRKPYHLMNLLRTTMTSKSGGYVTRRLHVPQEVWSQGGAKLANVLEKVRVVEVLCSALDDMQMCSVEWFGAGNVSSGLALGIGTIGRKEGEAWIAKLEEFSSICDGVVANFGKKLGVGEGFVLKKTSGVTTWGNKLTRQFDKFTNGKNLDSPAAYVHGLTKLFSHAQLLDEHTKALLSQPISPVYAAFPVDVRTSMEMKLKRCSEFFASVVLTFVIRDLSQLLDKYAKKCEKWLAE